MGSVDSSALRGQRETARNMSSRFFQVILGWYQISALLRVIPFSFFWPFSFLPTTHLWSKFVDHLHSWYFLWRSPSAQKNQCRLWWPFTINTRILSSQRWEDIYVALHLLRVAFSSTFCASSDLFFSTSAWNHTYKKDAVIAATCSSWHGLVLWLFFSETGGRWWLQYCRVILMWKADFCSLWGVEDLASVDLQASSHSPFSFFQGNMI